MTQATRAHEATAASSRPDALKIPYLTVHEPDGERTILYRFYDGAGELLYVGISSEPHRRWSAHERHSEWWDRVAVVHTEWRDTRAAAETAETEAIKRELPVFNRVHGQQQYRYKGGRFPASRLHEITRAHFGGTEFSFADLSEQLGVPSGTVVSYGNRLVSSGKFRLIGKKKAPGGRMRNYFVAAGQ
jgi:hypothetical protein